MEKLKRILFIFLVVLMAASVVACGDNGSGRDSSKKQRKEREEEEEEEDRKKKKDKDKDEEDSEETEEESAKEDSGEEKSGESASEEVLPLEKEELSKEELSKIEALLSGDDNGFLADTFARPEEINWDTVLYNGAGIGLTLTEEEKQSIADFTGYDPEAPVTAVLLSDVEKFAKEKTGVDYSEARLPLFFEFGALDNADIRYTHPEYDYKLPFTILEGYALGDDVYVTYRFEGAAADGLYDQPDYILHMKKAGDTYLYYSNLPADATPPKNLVDIVYYRTKAEAEKAGADEVVDTTETPSDDPMAWIWAVMEAGEDVRIIVDRQTDEGMGDYMRMESVFMPGENICNLELKKGEKAAVKVNNSWSPYMRAAVTHIDDEGVFYGDFLFGSELGLHRDDDNGPLPTYIMGYNCEDEGRNPDFKTEKGLYDYLQGDWIWLNPDTGKPEAYITIGEGLTAMLTNEENSYELRLEPDRREAKENELPDIISFYTSEEGFSDITGFQTSGGYSLGDYSMDGIQMDGEQQLTLFQENNGDGILNYILPGTDNYTYNFTFTRYKGATRQ